MKTRHPYSVLSRPLRTSKPSVLSPYEEVVQIPLPEFHGTKEEDPIRFLGIDFGTSTHIHVGMDQSYRLTTVADNHKLVDIHQSARPNMIGV